jgi:hypothetical protein
VLVLLVGVCEQEYIHSTTLGGSNKKGARGVGVGVCGCVYVGGGGGLGTPAPWPPQWAPLSRAAQTNPADVCCALQLTSAAHCCLHHSSQALQVVLGVVQPPVGLHKALLHTSTCN